MILYICRHAEAVPHHDAEDIDEHRWLSARGREDALAVAEAMKAREIRPSLLVSSPHVRAVQTAEIFAQVLGASPERSIWRELVLGRPLDPLLLRLENCVGIQESVMMVGHEPQVSSMTALLLGRAIRPFYTASVSRISLEEALPGSGREDWFLRPPRYGGELEKSG